MARILHLSRGGAFGGSQRQLAYVTEDLSPKHSHVIVCISPGPFVDYCRAHNGATQVMKLRPWRKRRHFFFRYRDARQLTHFAREQKIDLVHCADLWLSGYLFQVAEALGVPSVLHVRTPVSVAQVRKNRFAAATAIVAISRRVRENLLSAGIESRQITRIDDAIDTELFGRPPKTNVLRRDYPDSGPFLVGLAAHIRPAKKQLEFLQAIHHFDRVSSTKATFFLIGFCHDPAYLDRLQRFVREHRLHQRVVFTGNRPDMPDVLHSLDLLVSLSGGSVMFEGMACGTCVLSAGFTKREQAVHLRDGETGVLLDSQEPAELYAAMDGLLTDPKRRQRLGRQARDWAEQHLDRKRMARQVDALYAKLIIGTPCRRDQGQST